MYLFFIMKFKNLNKKFGRLPHVRLSVLEDANMEPARPRACATAHPDTAESVARTRAARRASGDRVALIPAPAFQVRGLIKYSRAANCASGDQAAPFPAPSTRYEDS